MDEFDDRYKSSDLSSARKTNYCIVSFLKEKELMEADKKNNDSTAKRNICLEDVIKNDKELIIQKYLERHLHILKIGIGVPEWAFNYVLPQFRLGSKYRADFLVVTGQSCSYEITIVELKRPEASLYTKEGIISEDLNKACMEISNYRRWINDNTEEFKRNIVEEIKKTDSSFEENFDWTRRFHICSKVVIGRRNKLTREIRDKNFDMEDIGIGIISYDRLIDAEKRICEMIAKGVDMRFYHYDDNLRNEYGFEIENKQPEYELFGTDNILFLGDEEREHGQYGFYKDMLDNK